MKINIGRSTGIITVNAKIEKHHELKKLIDDINKNLCQQITFDVNVISVSLNESAGAGIDLGLALSEAENT